MHETLRSNLTEEKIQQALLDPATVFAHPSDVVAAETLSKACRVEILRRWEYDALEAQVAEEEGLRDYQPKSLLDDVIAALHQLGTGPDIQHSPPTKQGGV